MSRKQVIILAALGAFVAVEIALFLFADVGKEFKPFPPDVSGVENGAVNGDGVSGVPDFIPEVPKNIEETPAEISEEINEGAGAGTKLGVFTITASKNGYEPSVLVVTEGDTIQLQFKSEGDKFDLYAPYVSFYLSADEGGEDQLSFIAPGVGTYLLKCRDFCPKDGIQGQLIVKPAEDN